MSLKVLELGGGPTIYQVISLVKYPVSIDFSDFLDLNLEEIKKWLKNKQGSFNWNEFIKFTLHLEGSKSTFSSIKARADMIRRKINLIMHCDLRKPNVLEINSQVGYDIVSVNFVPESITADIKEWNDFVPRILALVKPKGYLLMGAIVGARYYRVANSLFSAVSVSPEIIKGKLNQNNFSIKLTKFIAAEHKSEQGYSGIFMIMAQKT